MNYRIYTIDLPEFNCEGSVHYIQPFTSQEEAEEFALQQIKKWKPSDYPKNLMIVRELQFKDFVIQVFDRKQFERNNKIEELIN